MITAGRGSSKSSTIAQYCNWALNFARHNVSIVVGAADQDQANILLQRMKAEGAKNDYLDLTFRHYKIFGPTGSCEITSSEAATSAGRSDHITVVDELVWHAKPDLWQLLSTGGYIKRKDGILVCLTNSGIQGTWQHTLWLAAKQSSEWISYDVPPFAPSWLDRKKIDEQRKTLLPAYFARLFENRWIDPNEENAYLTREQVQACITIKKPLFGGSHYYVCSVDAAFVHDRTVACICHAEGDHVYLDEMKVWEGSKRDRFQLSELENWFAEVQKRFRVKLLVVDPTQLEGFVQVNEGRMEVERFSFNAKHKQLAETVRSLVLSQRLHIYDDAGALTLRDGTKETLLDELPALIVKESEGGNWRVDHVEGKHDDRYSCFIAGTMIDTDLGPKRIEDIVVGDFVLTRNGYKPVLASWCNGEKDVMTLECEDGRTLTGTGDHPVFANNKWIRLDNLRQHTLLTTWTQSYSTGLRIAGIPNPNGDITESIIRLTRNTKEKCVTCIGTYGRRHMEPFPRVARSITRTETRLTTTSLISHASLPSNILLCTQPKQMSQSDVTSNQQRGKSIYGKCGLPMKHGQEAPRGTKNCQSEPGSFGSESRASTLCASSAGSILTPISQRGLSIALMRAFKGITMMPINTRNSERANAAGIHGLLRNTAKPALAPISVRRVCDRGDKGLVYNLTVAECPEYFANGILVHNCLSMAALHCVTTRSPNPFTFAENLEKVFKIKKEEEMEYEHVKKYDAYGTYVPWPVLNGVAIKLTDYGTAQEAAIAVNEACKLLGQKAPHSKVAMLKRIDGEVKPDEELTKKRTEQIRAEVEKQLRDKRLLNDSAKSKSPK